MINFFKIDFFKINFSKVTHADSHLTATDTTSTSPRKVLQAIADLSPSASTEYSEERETECATMKRGNGKERARESDEGDKAAPSDVPRRVDDADEDRNARLAEMQLADLGLDRASYITGADSKGNNRRVDVKALERTLRVNTPGTSEYKEAQLNREGINAWRRAYDNLKDDGTHDGKHDINDGQSHREQLRKNVEESSGSRHQQSHSRGGGRGGRTNFSGRGGGVIGTRGRNDAAASSSRSTPIPLPATSITTRSNRGNNDYSIRGRGAPLPRVVEETPSRRSHPPPVTAAASVDLPVTRQRQALTYNLGAEAGSRDAFRAAMNRHAVSTTTLPQISQPATQSHSSSLGNQRASSATPPPITTSHPPTAQSDPVFGDEIDFAPTGTRIPTPPPPSAASPRSGSASSSYLNDLQGLDLSPSLQQEPWEASVNEQETNIRTETPADEECMTSNNNTGKPSEKDQESVKPDSSVNVEEDESRRSTSSASVQRNRRGSPVRITAQALLAQLLALPSIQSSPEFAQNVAQLQSQLGRLSQFTQSPTNAGEVSAAQNAPEATATDRQAAPTAGSNQSIPIVHNQPTTSDQSARALSNSGRVNVYLHDQRAIVPIPSSGNTRSISQTQRPIVNLPNPANAQSSTQERGNLTAGFAQEYSLRTAPTARASTSSSAMTGYVGRLQELHNTLAESIDTELGNIPPIRGDLRDSEYSNPFFRGALIIGGPVHEQGPAIIGDHLLPAGRQRIRNPSLSSSTTNLSSQATIRPHEESSFGNRRSNQPFVSPSKRSNTQANTQADITGLSSQLESLDLKDSHKIASAKEQSKPVHEKADLKQTTSSGKVYAISELLAAKPGPKDATQDRTRGGQIQPPFNRRTADAAPAAVEQPPVARRLNGVALDEARYPFTTRSVEPRPQTYEWLPLTSAQGQLATAAQEVTVASSPNARTVSSAGINTSTTIVPAAAANGSRSTAGSDVQMRETSNYLDNAITRQYAQAGQSSFTSNIAPASAQQSSASARRLSILSPQAAAFRVPQTSRSAASSASNVLSGDMTTSRWSDNTAPTGPQTSARGQQASTASPNASRRAFGGGMTASRWSDTPAPIIPQISASSRQALTAATNSPANVSGGSMAASRWSDSPAPTIPQALARGQQAPTATATAPGRVFGGDMNASRWGDNAQSTVLPARAQNQHVSATATSEYGRGILGTSWTTLNDVEITVVPTPPRALATATQHQTTGGGIAASDWNPNVASRAAAIALDQTSARPARGHAVPIRAPRETIDTSDPGIGDTTALFHNYNRPYRNQVPAFILGTASAAPEINPGPTARRQYGMESAVLADNTGRENQPMGRSSTKSVAGSDVSNSRQGQVHGHRL